MSTMLGSLSFLCLSFSLSLFLLLYLALFMDIFVLVSLCMSVFWVLTYLCMECRNLMFHRILQLAKVIVLILDGYSDISAQMCSVKWFDLYQDVLFGSQIILRSIFLSVCAACSEWPSDISSMAKGAISPMVFILDSCSFYFAHTQSKSGISICWRHLVK